MSIDYERVSGGLDFTGEATIGGIKFQKMGVGLCIGQIVDSDNFKVTGMTFKHSLQGLTSDTTKTVNAYTRCHLVFLLFCAIIGVLNSKSTKISKSLFRTSQATTRVAPRLFPVHILQYKLYPILCKPFSLEGTTSLKEWSRELLEQGLHQLKNAHSYRYSQNQSQARRRCPSSQREKTHLRRGAVRSSYRQWHHHR